MKLVILITAQTERSLDIAKSWEKKGASGVTILEGYGLRSLEQKLGIRDDLPLVPSLTSLLRQQEVSTMLLLTLVDDDLAKQIYQATVDILGDLTLPNNGIVFALDIIDVLGMKTHRLRSEQPAEPSFGSLH